MLDNMCCAKCGKPMNDLEPGAGKRYWHPDRECDLWCRECAPNGSLRCDYPFSAVEHRIATALERIAAALEGMHS